MKKRGRLPRLLAMCTAVAVIAWFAHPSWSKTVLPLNSDLDSTSVVIHDAFNFVPKYRRAECAVRWAYGLEEGAWVDLGLAQMEVFGRYLVTHAPKMAEYSVRSLGRGDQAFHDVIMFKDQCERRFDIAEAMIAKFLAQYPEVVNSKLFRGPVTEEEVKGVGGRIWIDSPDYDPQYWSIREAASKDCDAAKWVEVAQDAARTTEANTWNGRMPQPFEVILYATLAERLAKDPTVLEAVSSLRRKYGPHLPQPNHDEAVRLVDAYLATGACGKGR